MAIRIRPKGAKAKQPVAKGRRRSGSGVFNVPITRKSLGIASTEGCLRPDQPACPAVSGKASAYMYQKGCRAEACRLARRLYYLDWEPMNRERKALDAKRAAAKKKKAAKTKVPVKKAKAKR